MIAAEKITQLTQQIVAIAPPEKVILFGSYAYGHPTKTLTWIFSSFSPLRAIGPTKP
jgi:hypothetical protein